MKWITYLFIILLIACSGQDGEDGADGSDGGSEDGTIQRLSGKFQKGPCYKDGKIWVYPLDDGTLDQLGTHFIGVTKDYSGSYDIPANVLELWAEIFFEGDCTDEVTGGSGFQKLNGLIKVADINKNINPLTKIRTPVARWLFNDEAFGTIDASMIEAERIILLYLGMPALTQRFTEMNLEQDGTHDAVLALTSSMILYGRTPAEQGDYMGSIANGVIANDLTLKAEIASTIEELPLMTIRSNLMGRYAELDMSTDMPPIWRLGAPDYYADLLENVHSVTGTFNLSDTGTCSFDQSTFNTFAIPHVFDSGIETAKYIALNIQGDEISIWTRDESNDVPETKLVDIEKLDEILLSDPVTLIYNGMLPDSHSIDSSTDYYIVTRSDTDFTLSTACGNIDPFFLPFGRKLAKDEDGANVWEGNNNNTPFWRKSGIKVVLID